jgi:hypothetical protein
VGRFYDAVLRQRQDRSSAVDQCGSPNHWTSAELYESLSGDNAVQSLIDMLTGHKSTP